MNKRIYNAFNIATLIMEVIISPVVIWALSYRGSDAIAYIIAILILAFLLLAAIKKPIYTEFKDNGARSVFLFGFFEEIKWTEVEDIGETFFNKFNYYTLKGRTAGKKSFYTKMIIMKTAETQKILSQHLQGFKI